MILYLFKNNNILFQLTDNERNIFINIIHIYILLLYIIFKKFFYIIIIYNVLKKNKYF